MKTAEEMIRKNYNLSTDETEIYTEINDLSEVVERYADQFIAPFKKLLDQLENEHLSEFAEPLIEQCKELYKEFIKTTKIK